MGDRQQSRVAEGFERLRREGEAAAEGGDVRRGAALFCQALAVAAAASAGGPIAAADGAAAASTPAPAPASCSRSCMHVCSSAPTRGLPEVVSPLPPSAFPAAAGPSAAAPAPPSAAALAEVYDMLAQCLMELAYDSELARKGAGQDGGSAEAGSEAAGHASAGGGEDAEALWQKTLAASREAVALRPQWAPGLLTYGRCCRNMGQLDEAMRALNSAAQALLLVPPRLPALVAAAPGEGAGDAGAPGHVRAAPTPPGDPAAQEGAVQQRAPLAREGPATQGPKAQDEGLAQEVAAELREVSELWQRRLARDVGLPGLRVRQDAGGPGTGPGRRVWECGVLLAAYLVHRHRRNARPPLAGTRVLELGCGSGLVGVAAAACGAACMLTDLPALLPAAAESVAANGAVLHASSGAGQLAVRALDWAAPGGALADSAAWLLRGEGPWAAAGAREVGERVQAGSQARAGRPAEPGHCSGGSISCCWVVGADLAYGMAQVEPLVSVLKALRRCVLDAPVLGVCVRPACNMLLAHKHRSERVSGKLFCALEAAGMRLDVVDLAADEDGDFVGVNARREGGESESRLFAVAAAMPSVQVYRCELWPEERADL